MTIDDEEDDRSLAAIASLRTYDVTQRRARQLRRRCHVVLTRPPLSTRSASLANEIFRRVIGPALGGAWCLWYLAEIIGRAAAVYGLAH